MRSYLVILQLSILLLTACNSTPTQPSAGDKTDADTNSNKVAASPASTQPTDNFLIVPGEQVGHVHIMDSAAKPLRILGRPDGGDAAMGSAMMTWMGKGTPPTQLDVYTHYRDSTMMDKAVKQIRTTSPDFLTADGLHAGLLLSKATALQPGLKLVEDASSRIGTKLYDDAANGLAAETTGTGVEEKLVSIIVHEKGRGVRPVYQ